MLQPEMPRRWSRSSASLSNVPICRAISRTVISPARYRSARYRSNPRYSSLRIAADSSICSVDPTSCTAIYVWTANHQETNSPAQEASPVRNVTIALDAQLAVWVRVRAANHDTSVSRFAGDMLPIRQGLSQLFGL